MLEDVVADAELIEGVLRNAGIAFTARRVDNAAAFARETREYAPDIILSDYTLPQFTALNALRMLQENHSAVPMILVTGSQSEEVAVECLKQGAEDYILKTDLTRLPAAIQKALKNKAAGREREAAEKALCRSEERLRLITENTRDLISLVDVEGRFVYLSPSLLILLGYRPADLIDHNVFDLIHPEDVPAATNLLRQAKSTRASGMIELRCRHQDGSWKVFESSINWIIGERGEPQRAVLVSRDVTERLSLELQLRQAQKMESVGQLAAGVAHDFNNILTIIQGHAALLEMNSPLGTVMAESLKQISQATERASGLTRQLLMFSRKQVMQPKELDLNDLISNVAKMLRRLLGEHITVRFNHSLSLPPIYADAGMLEQVVVNLAVNARDAMSKGGNLTISTRTVQVDTDYVRGHPEARTGAFVCLTIADAGCGMDGQTLNHLFEPFFTTKGVGKGTGLGLATVYGIVKQHQGWIEVNSQVGQGSTFNLFFPGGPRALPVAPPRADALKIRGGQETVLLVEDEPALRELVLAILQNYGYRVLAAATGVQALKVWEQHKHEIDLLLTDLMMPEGITGRELAERVLAEDPELKVIYSSGYSVDTLEQEFALKIAGHFLQKPYQPELLARMIRQCLDERQESRAA